jgi:hypothetical protein
MASQSFQRILEVLDEHGVEYIVVGGVAAVLRGAPVTTFDIDALIKVDTANARRVTTALAALDARFREHPSALRPTLEDVLAGGHLLLTTDSGPLDVLGFIGGGKRYEDAAAHASVLQIGGVGVRVLDLDALIEDKKALGRAKDQATIAILESVLQRGGKG